MSHLLEGTRLMKTIARAVAIALVFAGMAFVGANPAQADEHKHPEVPEGIYTANVDGQATTEWTIWPSCVPTVGDLRVQLYLPVACRLHVTPSGRGGSDAVMTNGLWTFQYNTTDGRTCPDGSKAAQQEIYSFHGLTLVGNLKIIHGAVCGEQPGMTNIPFTLAFKEPLPIPVDRYPLICEKEGLRRCF
jgi:hypothetical protein